MLSSSAADNNNMEEARTYAKVAMWVNILGIITTYFGAAIGLCIFFLYFNKIDNP